MEIFVIVDIIERESETYRFVSFYMKLLYYHTKYQEIG